MQKIVEITTTIKSAKKREKSKQSQFLLNDANEISIVKYKVSVRARLNSLNGNQSSEL